MEFWFCRSNCTASIFCTASNPSSHNPLLVWIMFPTVQLFALYSQNLGGVGGGCVGAGGGGG